MVGRFVQHAQDHKWLALMTAASRADDPAAGALRRILLEALPDEEHSEVVLHRHNPQRDDGDGTAIWGEHLFDLGQGKSTRVGLS